MLFMRYDFPHLKYTVRFTEAQVKAIPFLLIEQLFAYFLERRIGARLPATCR